MASASPSKKAESGAGAKAGAGSLSGYLDGRSISRTHTGSWATSRGRGRELQGTNLPLRPTPSTDAFRHSQRALSACSVRRGTCHGTKLRVASKVSVSLTTGSQPRLQTQTLRPKNVRPTTITRNQIYQLIIRSCLKKRRPHFHYFALFELCTTVTTTLER